MNPSVILKVLEYLPALARVGLAVLDVVMKEREAGSTSTLDALRKVLTSAEAQELEDLALITSQRQKVVDALHQPSPYSEAVTRRITMPEAGGPKVPR